MPTTARAPSRTIVQMWSTRRSDISLFLFARCDDDTVWYHVIGDPDGWRQVPAIPQEDGEGECTPDTARGRR